MSCDRIGMSHPHVSKTQHFGHVGTPAEVECPTSEVGHSDPVQSAQTGISLPEVGHCGLVRLSRTGMSHLGGGHCGLVMF